MPDRKGLVPNMMIKNIFKIFKTELITIFKDPGTLLIMVGAIFLYSMFYLIPFSNHVLKHVPIGVVDMDNSNFSRELIRDINSDELVDIVSYPVDKEQAQKEYYKNKIQGYIVIAPNFEKDLLEGKNSNIGAFVDTAYIIIYKQIMTGINETVMNYSAKISVGRLVKAGVNKNVAMRIKQPFDYVQIPLFNPSGSYQNYIFPLILILVLQQTLLVGAGLLAGTRKELMIRAKKLGYKEVKFCEESNNPAEIILGRGFAYTALYFCYAIFYFIFFPAVACFSMNYDFIALTLITLPYIFATALLGQSMVAIVTERETSLLLIIVISVPLIFMPGYIWPRETMPLWLKIFSDFIPSTNGIDALVRINQFGAGFSLVERQFFILVGLCVFYFTTAYFATKKLCK
jgi:ABC-2 type transport system permease protein